VPGGRRLWGRTSPRVPFHGAPKYCHNGGMVFACWYGRSGSVSKSGDDGPLQQRIARPETALRLGELEPN
jgi:hypothetical protein